MPFILSRDEWTAKMEKQGVELLERDNMILAADGGAWRIEAQQAVAPPAKHQDRLRAQLFYQKYKIKLMENAFQQFEINLETQLDYFKLGAGPPPQDEDFERLQALRERIEATRQTIEEIQSDIMPTQAELVAEQREKERMIRLEVADSLKAKLRRLTI